VKGLEQALSQDTALAEMASVFVSPVAPISNCSSAVCSPGIGVGPLEEQANG
jgi:hypothetical protein